MVDVDLPSDLLSLCRTKKLIGLAHSQIYPFASTHASHTSAGGAGAVIVGAVMVDVDLPSNLMSLGLAS